MVLGKKYKATVGIDGVLYPVKIFLKGIGPDHRGDKKVVFCTGF